MLESFNLYQHVTRPTRSKQPLRSSTLIDHIISNTYIAMYYHSISDHDGPYACINIRVSRFQPRFKMLRNERQFKETDFKDLNTLPFCVVYSLCWRHERKIRHFKLPIFKSCLDKHAPLRKTKITRLPAPWLNKDNIRELQKERTNFGILLTKRVYPVYGTNFVKYEIRSEWKSKRWNALFFPTSPIFQKAERAAVEHYSSHSTS
jgi:hypothetical protein